MIWVRWAIPDMSSKLRDKIRREAYITNEIIIKQEAERARKAQCNRFLTFLLVSKIYVRFSTCFSKGSISDRFGDASMEPKSDSKRIEQLLSSNLSGSQLDLVMHGEGNPFAPGHAKPHQIEHKTNNKSELNKMFLESEKNGIARRNVSSPVSNEFSAKESGETPTETSTL